MSKALYLEGFSFINWSKIANLRSILIVSILAKKQDISRFTQKNAKVD
jgi:hypothetical protein